MIEYRKQYYLNNKEKITAKNNKYYLEHREESIARRTKHYHDHKEENKAIRAQYFQEHKQEMYPSRRAYTNKRHNETKVRAINYLGGKCQMCGLISQYPEVYDFHHKNPELKEFKLGSLMSCKWAKVQEELNKCELLCSNCHRIKHNSLKE